MGKRRKKLFNKKNFFLNRKYNYLLNHISSNFSFCSKVFIICKKKDKPTIKFTNTNNKISFIFLKKTFNQIDTIIKSKKKLINNCPFYILNPDAYFSLKESKKQILKKIKDTNFAIFGIKNYQESTNKYSKDTFKIYKNHVSLVNIKSGHINNKNFFVSAGLYYFKNFNFFLTLYKKFIIKNNYKKPFYQIAHLFKIILELNQKIDYFFVRDFIDLGDESHLDEYFFWLKFFKYKFFKNDNLNLKDIFNIIPSAGEGSRHKKLGYRKPKPLIPLSGKTMFENSLFRLPNKNKNLFIFRKKTFDKYNIKKIFLNNKYLDKYFTIKKKTKGMAETILLSKNLIPLDKPVLVSSCDISFVINYSKFYNLLQKEPDGIIFTWRKYPFANESPNSHAYVKTNRGRVTLISEKKTISKNPNEDFAVTGVFYFKNSKLLINCIEHMIKNKITVNNEYYVATSMDKMLKDNLKIYNFEVDQFISWSLPEHLQKYLFWENIFK